MKCSASLLLLLLVSFLVVGCSNDSSTDKVVPRTYKIGMVHWAAYSPLNVAEVKGFWKEQGIDVDVVNYTDGTELYARLDDKGVDIALDMIGSWVDLYLQGKPYTIIGETDWSHGGDKVIMKRGKSLADLKGSRLGVYLDLLSVKYFVNKYLTANGTSFSDFNVVEVGNPDSLADKFISGEFEIEANYDPYVSRAVAEGDGVVGATSADYSGCIPEGFVARRDVLATIPQEDLVKIFRGWIKAVKWAADSSNWKEYRQILMAETFPGDGITTDDQLRTFLGAVKIHSQSEGVEANKTDGGLYKFLTDLEGFARKNGYEGKGFTPQEIFDNRAIMVALGGE